MDNLWYQRLSAFSYNRWQTFRRGPLTGVSRLQALTKSCSSFHLLTRSFHGKTLRHEWPLSESIAFLPIHTLNKHTFFPMMYQNLQACGTFHLCIEAQTLP